MDKREPSLDRHNNEVDVYPATSNDLERNTAASPACLSLPIIQFYRGCSVYMYPIYGSYKTAHTSLFLRRSLINHRCLGALLSPARTCFNGTDCNKVRLTYINAVNWKETICRSLLVKHNLIYQNDFHYYTHVQLYTLPPVLMVQFKNGSLHLQKRFLSNTAIFHWTMIVGEKAIYLSL